MAQKQQKNAAGSSGNFLKNVSIDPFLTNSHDPRLRTRPATTGCSPLNDRKLSQKTQVSLQRVDPPKTAQVYGSEVASPLNDTKLSQKSEVRLEKMDMSNYTQSMPTPEEHNRQEPSEWTLPDLKNLDQFSYTDFSDLVTFSTKEKDEDSVSCKSHESAGYSDEKSDVILPKKVRV